MPAPRPAGSKPPKRTVASKQGAHTETCNVARDTAMHLDPPSSKIMGYAQRLNNFAFNDVVNIAESKGLTEVAAAMKAKNEAA